MLFHENSSRVCMKRRPAGVLPFSGICSVVENRCLQKWIFDRVHTVVQFWLRQMVLLDLDAEILCKAVSTLHSRNAIQQFYPLGVLELNGIAGNSWNRLSTETVPLYLPATSTVKYRKVRPSTFQRFRLRPLSGARQPCSDWLDTRHLAIVPRRQGFSS